MIEFKSFNSWLEVNKLNSLFSSNIAKTEFMFNNSRQRLATFSNLDLHVFVDKKPISNLSCLGMGT